MSLTPEQRSDILLGNIEQSDCGIIALQAITGEGRQVCLDMALAAGFTYENGMPRDSMEKALNAMGYRVRIFYPEDETPATFSLAHEVGVYLVYVPKHVMALVSGDLHNCRGYFSSPVDQVTQVQSR